jgi:glycosyl transferase, family 25
LDIYVINLDKDVHRLRWMEQQLNAHQLGFLRVAGVNGALCAERGEPYCFNPIRTHLAAAEIGCLLSHFNAWRLIAQADGEYGLVLEDDIHVSGEFGDLIHNMSLDPQEFCVHKLETFGANVTLERKPSYTVRRYRAFKLETNHGGSGAYIISKKTAARLLNYLDLFHEAMDIELFDPNRRTIKELTIHQWVPAPCIQDFLLREPKIKQNFTSNMGKDRADRKTFARYRTQKVRTFFRSRLRRLYTTLYSLWLWPIGRMRRKIEFA